jgi:hypothetical protein
VGILNYSDVTKGIEDILNQRLSGYVITRNDRKNADPNRCPWIGIYRGSLVYEAHTIGGRPWKASPSPQINIQVASTLSGDDAEDRLQEAEKEVIEALETDRTLGSTVSMILGYNINYEYSQTDEIYYHGCTITIRTETRS